MTDRFAPKGAVWVCAACGKRHSDKYGIEGWGNSGWDESCILNAVLCHDRMQVVQQGLIEWVPFDKPTPKPVSAKEQIKRGVRK